jgi:lysozyme
MVLMVADSALVYAATPVREALPREVLEVYEAMPHVRAFLDTIAYSEGTYKRKFVLQLRPLYAGFIDGYRMQFSYVAITSLKKHPERVICKKTKKYGELCSSAAGRYQFLKRTWADLAERMQLSSFERHNQDRAAIQLIADYYALSDVLQGRFEDAVAKLVTVWASFPGAPYAQPTRSMAELKAFYLERLKKYGVQ